ncbi:pre-tRNA nuclear export protein [Borealophlyctis nickersoniae]|nr:pre-tRNA nuclear export protein [Borealophlyctis nickersoniae]
MDETELVYLRNKFALVIVLVFQNQYPHEWPSFFDDLLALLASTSGTPKHPAAIDMFLRISLALDDEVVNLYIQRSGEDTKRNADIKDAMRVSAVGRLTETWYNILTSSWQTNPEVANVCLNLFARYVSWIDIKLVVGQDFISGLYQFLTTEPLRMAACQCLTEIVNKGMKPLDKLGLLQALNVTDVLGQLDIEGDVEFAEQVAKLVNVMGVELGRCWEESDSFPEAKEAAVGMLSQVFPFLIKLFGNEYDDTTSVLFPFLDKYLAVIKKEKRAGGDLALERYEANLLELLRVVIFKMKYDEEEDWQFGAGAGEDEAAFSEMRKSLKVYFDAVAAIDRNLFITCVSTTVCTTLDDLTVRGMGAKTWSEAELALHLLYLFSEALFSLEKGSPSFTVTAPDGTVSVTPLGEMVSKMLKSNISSYPHDSIPFVFFDNVARYASFFESFVEFIPDVLGPFVDTRGLHHENSSVRSRVSYHFLKFVEKLRTRALPYVDNVLTSIQDLLIVRRPPPTLPSPPTTPVTPKPGSTATSFDSQLYLFEAVGMLISLDPAQPEKQVELLTAVIRPLMNQMEEIMQKELYKQDVPPDNVVFTTQLNHIIRAIGSTSKGFPDFNTAVKTVQAVPAWTAVFKQALQAIVVVLERLNSSELIREASRYSFQRMVGCMGPEAMEHIRPLVTAGLLSSSTAKELVDFIPFIALIIHRFSPTISPVINDLFPPLTDRIFFYLNQPASGTDDAFEALELRRQYLVFITHIFNANMEEILISETNMPRLNTITQSVLHYANDCSDPASQKAAFSVIGRMIGAWGGAPARPAKSESGSGAKSNGSTKTSPVMKKKGMVGAKMDRAQSAPQLLPDGTTKLSPALSQSQSQQQQQQQQQQSQSQAIQAEIPAKPPLPGFDRFLLDQVLPNLFAVPLKPEFSLADGSAIAVMGEIATCHKLISAAMGEGYYDYLINVFLPSIGCPGAIAEQFVGGLRGLEAKSFRKFLTSFIQNMKA